ncbi:MAG: MBOAT family protein [Clostridiales bacterium]|nr:MBOAT family protein [Clostridiales bacterium]
MVFSSLLFLYAFFPLNMLAYRIAPDIKAKNWVMLVFSLVFYAWAGPVYVLLLVGMTYADYIAALWIDAAKRKSTRKKMLFRGCAINLGLLCIFKYLTFILQNFHDWWGFPWVPQIALPIGISFYTFQLISYMVDVYREQVPAQKDFKVLLLYVSLFHQCIAGPIVRYETIEQELTGRKFRRSDMAGGIRRFTVGLAKKALLSNYCGSLADTFLVSTSAEGQLATITARPALSIWLGVLCYTLQIYLDFSAYSDMAIGMGQMIGFHYDENFNYPYCVRSIRDFWRRWHISLSSFFRDYVYIPLGGSRRSVPRVILNLLVVWALTGLWHGASWNYVFWGLYYFVFLVLERYVLRGLPEKMPHWLNRVYVLGIVGVGWLLFRCEDISVFWAAMRGLIGLNGNGFSNYETNLTLRSNLFFLIVAVVACTPFVVNQGKKLAQRAERKKGWMRLYQGIQMLSPILLTLLSTAALVGDSYNPFLYFRF